MKKYINVTILRILCLFLIGLSSSAHAIFTTAVLKVETPGIQKEIPLLGVDIKLAQLGIPINTSNMVNSVFNDTHMARIEIQNELRNEILSLPEVRRVRYSLVDIYPLSAELRQQNNAFIATLSGLRVRVGGEASGGIPIICSSPDFSVDINNITASLEYNIFTGNLAVSNVDFDLHTDADCGGLLGFIGDIFVEPVFQDLVEGTIDDAITGISSTIAMEQLFSIQDLAETIATADLGSDVPPQVDQALAEISDMLLGINLNTGKRISVELQQRKESQYEGTFVLTFTTNTLVLSTNF